jgi:hypothetical protein
VCASPRQAEALTLGVTCATLVFACTAAGDWIWSSRGRRRRNRGSPIARQRRLGEDSVPGLVPPPASFPPGAAARAGARAGTGRAVLRVDAPGAAAFVLAGV